MTTATNTSMPGPTSTVLSSADALTYGGLPLWHWLKIVTVALLMMLLFRFNLGRLWLKTNPFYGQPNWGHAPFVPIVGLYYLYVHWQELLSPGTSSLSAPLKQKEIPAAGSARLRLRLALSVWLMVLAVCGGLGFFPSVISRSVFEVAKVVVASIAMLSLFLLLWGTLGAADGPLSRMITGLRATSSGWLGGFILAWGVLFSMWGIWPGQNDFFKDVGMIVALFGVVLFLCGWAVMRTAWFPILFLFCALPWPDQVYSWVAGPLQHLAASVAVHVLRICNIPSLLSGTKIIILQAPGVPRRVLNVEEACAGLRSLMTFITLAAGWGFVFMASRPLWHRLVLTASAVPIAIFCNVVRVSGTGLLDRVNHQLSESFAHRFVGLIMLIPAFFLILGVSWALDRLFMEEIHRDPADGALERPLADRRAPGIPKPASGANKAAGAARSSRSASAPAPAGQVGAAPAVPVQRTTNRKPAERPPGRTQAL